MVVCRTKTHYYTVQFYVKYIFHEYKDVEQTCMAGLSHVNHTANLLKSLLTKENW